MREILFAAGLLGLIAGPAQALGTADCARIEGRLFGLLEQEFGISAGRSAGSAARALDNGCGVTELDIRIVAAGVTLRAGDLVLSGDGLMPWARGEAVLPRSLDLTLTGVMPNTGPGLPADLTWLNGVTARSIRLAFTWDRIVQALRVDPLRIDLGDDNSVTLRIEGRAAGWRPDAAPPDDFGTTRLDLEIAFNGVFERVVVPPIEANGNDMSPEAMAFMAAMAEGLMANAPRSLLAPDARAEIVGFLRSLPAPRGDLRLTLTNDTPFSTARVLQDLRTGVPFDRAVPGRLNIGATWAPAN